MSQRFYYLERKFVLKIRKKLDQFNKENRKIIMRIAEIDDKKCVIDELVTEL